MNSVTAEDIGFLTSILSFIWGLIFGIMLGICLITWVNAGKHEKLLADCNAQLTKVGSECEIIAVEEETKVILGDIQ